MTETTTPQTTSTQPATPNLRDTLQNLELSQAQSALLAAEGRFAQAHARLHDTDGQPLYAPAEHQRQMQRLQDDADQAVSAAMETIDDIARASQMALEHLQGGEQGQALTDADWQRANARAPFIERDCQTLPVSTLLARLEMTRQSGDRALLYLHHRYASARLEAANRETAEQHTPHPFTLDERQRLSASLDALAAALRGPDAAQLAERERATLAKTREIRARARRLHNTAHEAEARLEAEMRARLGAQI